MSKLKIIQKINSWKNSVWRFIRGILLDAPNPNATVQDDLRQGVILKLSASFFYVLILISVKQLNSKIPPGEIVFFRSVVALIPLALVIKINGGFVALRTKNIKIHCSRTVSSAFAMIFYKAGIVSLNLSAAMSLYFLNPAFAALFARKRSGEKLSVVSILAFFGCFVGMLFILQPFCTELRLSNNVSLLTWGVMFSLIGALFAGHGSAKMREMGKIEPNYRGVTYLYAFTAIIGFGTMWFWFNMPSFQQLGILVLIGVFGFFAQFFSTLSYRYAQTAWMSALDFSQVVLGILIGIFWFSEIPSFTTWVGVVLIIVSGCSLIFYAKNQVKNINSIN